jgi:hypothetical protein
MSNLSDTLANANNNFVAKNTNKQLPKSVTSSSVLSNRVTEIRDFTAAERKTFNSILTSIHLERGSAATLIAGKLFDSRLASSYLAALMLSVELIESETDAVCEVISTLLNDGWSGGVGSLLDTARRL